MRNIQRLFLRACALTILAAGAALSAASGCGLIAAETDCTSACTLFNTCGLTKTGSCGGYCAALVAGAAIAGCGTEFDTQNQCAKDNSVCTAAAQTCAPHVAAFATCMAAFCKKTPSASGCSVVTMQAPDGGK